MLRQDTRKEGKREERKGGQAEADSIAFSYRRYTMSIADFIFELWRARLENLLH